MEFTESSFNLLKYNGSVQIYKRSITFIRFGVLSDLTITTLILTDNYRDNLIQSLLGCTENCARAHKPLNRRKRKIYYIFLKFLSRIIRNKTFVYGLYSSLKIFNFVDSRSKFLDLIEFTGARQCLFFGPIRASE